jgi:hypothetical protein
VPTGTGNSPLEFDIFHQVIVDADGNVNGVIDWEKAAILPLGMGAWCIRFLSMETIRGVDHTLDKTLDKTGPMARAFWQSLVTYLPSPLRSLEENIVLAMQIGYVMISVFYEGGGTPGPRLLDNLLERLDWMAMSFPIDV